MSLLDDFISGFVEGVVEGISMIIDVILEVVDLVFDLFASIINGLLAIADYVVSIFLPDVVKKAEREIQRNKEIGEQMQTIINSISQEERNKDREFYERVQAIRKEAQEREKANVEKRAAYSALRAKGATHIVIPVQGGQVVQGKIRAIHDKANDPRVAREHGSESIKVYS